MTKKRIDRLLLEHGFAASLTEAGAILMAGNVMVNSQRITVPGMLIDSGAEISVKSASPYVSRGGYKLAAALDTFKIDPTGAICADVGASTGGFTDVLLQRGAKKVYALDVGYGDLAWKLRQDPRVVVMERTNARNITRLPELISLVVVDASFISLKHILPAALKWTAPNADLVTLIKPQFEAEKEWVEKGGVVRKKEIHAKILNDMISWCVAQQLGVIDLTASPITGPAGNKEFLLHLSTEVDVAQKPFQLLTDTCLSQLSYK